MHGATRSNYSRLALVILTTLLLTGALIQCLMWFQPATLLPVIADDLSLSYSQSGLYISILCLLAALIGPFAGVILIRIGLKNAFAASILFIAAGTIGSLVAGNYTFLLFTRVLVGIGIGLAIPVGGVATISWFSERTRPILNSVFAVLPYVAAALNFGVTVQLFYSLDSNWKLTLAIPGLILLPIVIAWMAQKRVHFTRSEAENEKSDLRADAKLIRELLGNKQVLLICFAEACDMWGFEFLSTYLTTHLHEGGMPLEEAAGFSTVFPVAGIIACLVCGSLMVYTKKRKIFTWPMHLMIFAGTLMLVFFRGVLQIIGIFLAGFGNAGWAPALYTMPMEFKGMTAKKVGLVYSAMFSLGYLTAFISPPFGGWIAQKIGLDLTIAIFAGFALIAALLTFSMDETHPEKK